MQPAVTIALKHSEKPMGCPVITPAGKQALGIQFSHNHLVSWWRVSLMLADKVNH
jgi:hypothetical protein